MPKTGEIELSHLTEEEKKVREYPKLVHIVGKSVTVNSKEEEKELFGEPDPVSVD